MSDLTYSAVESPHGTRKTHSVTGRRLEGWQRGGLPRSVARDALLIDIRARLASALATRRAQKQMTQAELARRIQSSQSRVAKMEAADASVSLDLLIRSLWRLAQRAKIFATAIVGK